jgi:hypothetical protein
LPQGTSLVNEPEDDPAPTAQDPAGFPEGLNDVVQEANRSDHESHSETGTGKGKGFSHTHDRVNAAAPGDLQHDTGRVDREPNCERGCETPGPHPYLHGVAH